jgi:RND family efflux transporter MFP subunit
MAKRRWLRVWMIVLLLVLGGGGWFAFSWLRPVPRNLQAAGEQPTKVERGRVEDTLLVTGVVKPSVTIDLRSEASGLVASVHVNEGERVAAGQILLTLDSRVAVSQLQEAEAQLKQAKLQESAALLDLDEDTVAIRRKTHERNQALFGRGYVPQNLVDESGLQLRAAERSLERAKRNMESNKARIEQLEAGLERARTQLQHATIRSPLDAWVIRRQVEVGSGVAGLSQSSAGGTVLLTLGDARQASLSAKVTAADARKLKVGQLARIRMDSDPEKVVEGKVQTVSTAGDIDPQTRLTTFPVVLAVTTTADAAWINVPAQAEIVLGAKDQAVVVPDGCLRTGTNSQTWVMAQGASGFERRDVTVGAVQRGKVEIAKGVEAGQTLMCRGAAR